MSNSYHNTTLESGATLDKRERKAKSQEDLILDYFQRRYHFGRSPSQVQQRLGLQRVPITSIRRAMTNLTARGKLIKTDAKVDGPFGHQEYLWKLNRHWPDQQQELFS